MKIKRFSKAYIKSMRPYSFFITGLAGWLGIVFSNSNANILRQIVVLTILFTGWGINQIINDFLGLKEDRINAPHRPMVTGELNIKYALVTTFLLFLMGGLITFFLNPYALIFYLMAYIFNIIYSYMKRIPLAGNLWFGILMAVCTFYGASAVSNRDITLIYNKNLIYIALFVALIGSTMSFFTYFKDYLGDKLAKRRTIVVCVTPEKAKYLGFVMGILPFLVLFAVVRSSLWQPEINIHFLILIAIAFLIFQYTAFLYFKNPTGDKTYYSLVWNFRGDVLFKTSFIALVNPLLSIILFIIGFTMIGYLFNIHKNPLA